MSKTLSTQPKERSAEEEVEERMPEQAKRSSKDEPPVAAKHQPLSLFTKDSLTSFVGGGIAGAGASTSLLHTSFYEYTRGEDGRVLILVFCSVENCRQSVGAIENHPVSFLAGQNVESLWINGV